MKLAKNKILLFSFQLCHFIVLAQPARVTDDAGVEKNSDPFDHHHLSGFDITDHVPGEPFSPIDFQNAAGLLSIAPPTKFYDPIELAGLYEGDIILNQANQRTTTTDSTDGDYSPDEAERNAVIVERQKWVGGIVPYFISAQFNAYERSIIARAFLEYQSKTCIVFRPRTTEVDYVHIMKGNGCSSHVGRTGGGQPVTLGDGCVYPGIAVHELMHAVGFWHEQSRWDRDEFVNVYLKNVAPGMEFNFNKYSWRDIQNLSVSYDTSSVLHYGPYAFAKDRRYPTLLPKNPNDKMGQREGFSPKDILKINRLYNCKNKEPSTTPTTTTTTAPSIIEETTPAPADIEGSSSVTNGSAIRCTDSHKYCPQWSQKGECQKNPWMTANCQLSCDSCSPCSDLNKFCRSWALKGECTRNPHYMTVYCAKSCTTCTSTKL